MDARRTLIVATVLLLALPVAFAGPQPADTYPAGVEKVQHSDIRPGSDFSVQIILEEGQSADRVTLYVCEYDALGDEEPGVCYMPVKALGNERWFEGRTRDTQHPEWTDGTELGYKLVVEIGDDDRKVPADGGYYRVLVAEAPAGDDEGSPVDAVAPNEDAQRTPWPAVFPGIAAAGALAMRRRGGAS